MSPSQIANGTGTKLPDYRALLEAVRSTPTGQEHADDYHRAVADLLTALFYPALTMPHIEYPIHEGRKRIDIRFVNSGNEVDFFGWVASHYTAPHVYVECKNYGNEVANPELDQLAGRFGTSRGQVGVLAVRKFKNKALFLRRCKDTAVDGRGYILALDDSDLTALVQEADQPAGAIGFAGLLKAKFDQLTD